jgi:hypothetical protein
LNLGANQLTGQIPLSVSFALKLTSLFLHDNNLTGSVPVEIGQLNLQALRVQGNVLTGPLPLDTMNVAWLTTLQELWVQDNRITGGIPSILGSAPRMQDLRLGQNRLGGNIPESLYNLNRLFRLEVPDNRLTGTISPRIDQLPALEILDVSDNRMIGPIDLDGLSNLREVRIQFNTFSGSVPENVCAYPSLEVLQADCLPPSNPPNPCTCCTECCSRAGKVCAGGTGGGASPVQAPVAPPSPSGGAETELGDVQRWALDTFGDDISFLSGTPHALASQWIADIDSQQLTLESGTFLQRYVLALFYFETGPWRSCNPGVTLSCLFQKFVRNEDDVISFEAVPATRWMAGVSECDWVGVECSAGDVVGVELCT